MAVVRLESDGASFYQVTINDKVLVREMDFNGSSKSTPVVKLFDEYTIETWTVAEDLFIDIYETSTIDNLPVSSIENVSASLDLLAEKHIISSLTVNMARSHMVILRTPVSQ